MFLSLRENFVVSYCMIIFSRRYIVCNDTLPLKSTVTACPKYRHSDWTCRLSYVHVDIIRAMCYLMSSGHPAQAQTSNAPSIPAAKAEVFTTRTYDKVDFTLYEFGKILSIKDQTSPGSQVARYQTAICRLLCPNCGTCLSTFSKFEMM